MSKRSGITTRGRLFLFLKNDRIFSIELLIQRLVQLPTVGICGLNNARSASAIPEKVRQPKRIMFLWPTEYCVMIEPITESNARHYKWNRAEAQ